MQEIFKGIHTEIGIIKPFRDSIFLDSMEQKGSNLSFNGEINLKYCDLRNGYECIKFNLIINGITEFTVVDDDHAYGKLRLDTDSAFSESISDDTSYRKIAFETYDWTYLIKCKDYKMTFFEGRRYKHCIFLIGNEGFEELSNINYKGSSGSHFSEQTGSLIIMFKKKYDIELITVEDKSAFKEELSTLPFTDPQITMVRYSSVEAMRKLLSLGNFPEDMFVYNNDGVVVPLDEFIQMGMPMV